MRTASAWTIALAAAIAGLQAQTNQPASSAEPVRTYTLLGKDEDWSFLKDPSLRQDFWDPLKYIPLGTDGWYLSIGGGMREAFEQVGNDNWGKQNYTNTFFLERYVLHTDWHFGRHFRAYVELKSGLESFRQGGPRPIDEKKLDFEEAFVELSTGEGDGWAALDVGRQELYYGSGRLVSVREGPNVRQSFDGARLKSKVGTWRIDLWAVRPDLDKPGFFDNVPDHSTAFWGVYATRPWRRRVSFDNYYLGLDHGLPTPAGSRPYTYNRGTASETRHTLGARLWRPPSMKEPELHSCPGFSREQQLWRSSHSLFPQHWFRTRSGCRRVHRRSWASRSISRKTWRFVGASYSSAQARINHPGTRYQLYGILGGVQILKTRGGCHEGSADFVCRRLDGGCYLCAFARSESSTAFSGARRTAGYGLGRASDYQLSGETKPDNVRPT